MSLEIIRKCDACGADLGDSGPVPSFYLALSAVQRPQSGGICYAVHITPPIEGTAHLCGLSCLRTFLAEKGV